LALAMDGSRLQRRTHCVQLSVRARRHQDPFLRESPSLWPATPPAWPPRRAPLARATMEGIGLGPNHAASCRPAPLAHPPPGPPGCHRFHNRHLQPTFAVRHSFRYRYLRPARYLYTVCVGMCMPQNRMRHIVAIYPFCKSFPGSLVIPIHPSLALDEEPRGGVETDTGPFVNKHPHFVFSKGFGFEVCGWNPVGHLGNALVGIHDYQPEQEMPNENPSEASFGV